jgi:hypothetical protein
VTHGALLAGPLAIGSRISEEVKVLEQLLVIHRLFLVQSPFRQQEI